MGSSEEALGVGRIIAHHGLLVHIKTDDDLIKFKPPRRSDWVVGDIAIFKGDRPVDIEPRTTELSRIGSNGKKQVLAANIDTLLIVTASGEMFKPTLVDRFIVAARHADITPVVVVNKIDVSKNQEIEKAEEAWATYSIPVLATSAISGDGISELSSYLKGSLAAMVGQSGVGKTSILNRMIPGLKRPTAPINVKTEKGAHTTTLAELINIPDSGSLIDSPGIRQFVPSGIAPRDVAPYFPGFEDYLGGCKFRDCLHLTEPGCPILEARDDNKIPAPLYDSYCRLLTSIQEDESANRKY